jgi:hypothetical protein
MTTMKGAAMDFKEQSLVGLQRAVGTFVVVLVLLPLLLASLLRFGVLLPTEQSITIGPLRLATTCWSKKRFCVPLENANPPPSEVFILIDWPGGERREEVLLIIPLR